MQSWGRTASGKGQGIVWVMLNFGFWVWLVWGKFGLWKKVGGETWTEKSSSKKVGEERGTNFGEIVLIGVGKFVWESGKKVVWESGKKSWGIDTKNSKEVKSAKAEVKRIKGIKGYE